MYQLVLVVFKKKRNIKYKAEMTLCKKYTTQRQCQAKKKKKLDKFFLYVRTTSQFPRQTHYIKTTDLLLLEDSLFGFVDLAQGFVLNLWSVYSSFDEHSSCAILGGASEFCLSHAQVFLHFRHIRRCLDVEGSRPIAVGCAGLLISRHNFTTACGQVEGERLCKGCK